jgi:phage terminase small subunit
MQQNEQKTQKLLKYSHEELINYLRELAQQLGRTPKKRDIHIPGKKISYSTYRKYFGSLRNAQKAAGLVPTESVFKKKYSRDDLLNHLKELAQELGRTPKEKDIAAAGKIANNTYTYHFGNLKNAQIAAGLAPTFSGRQIIYSKDELINHMRELASQLGRTPSQKDIAVAGKVSYYTYYTHFGSLRNAQVAAGLVPTESAVKKKYSREDLLNHLKELARQLGRTPKQKDITAAGRINRKAYEYHFGNLKNALIEAGLIPADKHEYTLPKNNISVSGAK